MRDKNITVGLLGATGATGKGALTLLLKYVDDIQINIGGRNIERIRDLVRTISPDNCEKLIYQKVDLTNIEESESFIKKCDVVVNCAGPYSLLGDSIINLCIDNQIKLSDVSSYDALHDHIPELCKKAENKGALVAISAGINPGLTEMIPFHLINGYYDETKEIKVYFAGSGELSYNATYDIVETVGKKTDAHFISCVKEGTIQKCEKYERKKTFRDPIGKRVIFPVINNEFYNLINHCTVGTAYYYDAYMIPLINDPCIYAIDTDEKKKEAARILSSKTKGCKKYGIIRAEAIGLINGEEYLKLIELFYEGSGEELTGIVAASVGMGMVNDSDNKKGYMRAYEAIEFEKIVPYLSKIEKLTIVEEDVINGEK